MARRKKKSRYTIGQKTVRALPRVIIFLFLSLSLMTIVIFGTREYFFELGDHERLAMMSALAGVAFYYAFKTIDNTDWSVKKQFITSFRYIFYFIIFFIGLNLIIFFLQSIRENII